MKKRIYLSTLVFLFMSIVAIMQTKIVSKANIPNEIRIGENHLVLYGSTNENKTEFTGENWRYEKSSNTLYLDNCQLNDFIQANGSLNIVVSGTNAITGVRVNDELSIFGNGVLNVNFDDSNMTKLTKSCAGAKGRAIISVPQNCTISDCTMNINVTSKKPREVVGCNGALSIEKSSISILTNGNKNKFYYDMISGYGISIKESSLNLQGVFEGMYSLGDVLVDNSNIYVRCNNKTQNGYGMQIYGEMNVKNSTIDVKSPRTAMLVQFLKSNKSTIRLDSYGKKDLSEGNKFWRDGGLSLDGCNIKNSNMDIKGHFYGIIFEGESSQYIINNSQINVTAKKKSGIYVTKRNSLKIKNGGKISIMGKKYAIEVEKKKIKFYGYSKLQFKVTKSLVNLKGKKVSNLGSLSKKKKTNIKNGNYVITRKK